MTSVAYSTPPLDFSQAVRDQFPGTSDEEIPGLIKMLRTLRPDDQLRIERNYWRARSVELAEEVIIWQRRAEGPKLPTQDLFAQLEAQVKAAASRFELNMAAARPEVKETFYPDAAATAEENTAPPLPPEEIPASAAVPQTGDAAELRSIRTALRFSQASMSYRLGIGQSQLSKYERGAPVPARIMALAREQRT